MHSDRHKSTNFGLMGSQNGRIKRNPKSTFERLLYFLPTKREKWKRRSTRTVMEDALCNLPTHDTFDSEVEASNKYSAIKLTTDLSLCRVSWQTKRNKITHGTTKQGFIVIYTRYFNNLLAPTENTICYAFIINDS